MAHRAVAAAGMKKRIQRRTPVKPGTTVSYKRSLPEGMGHLSSPHIIRMRVVLRASGHHEHPPLRWTCWPGPKFCHFRAQIANTRARRFLKRCFRHVTHIFHTCSVPSDSGAFTAAKSLYSIGFSRQRRATTPYARNFLIPFFGNLF